MAKEVLLRLSTSPNYNKKTAYKANVYRSTQKIIVDILDPVKRTEVYDSEAAFLADWLAITGESGWDDRYKVIFHYDGFEKVLRLSAEEKEKAVVAYEAGYKTVNLASGDGTYIMSLPKLLCMEVERL